MQAPPVPDSATTSAERRRAIRELLSARPAATQAALVEALSARGLAATQSSVSRDLRELGALKTTDGYVLPREVSGEDEIAAVSSLVKRLQAAGPNLLVIHTAIGAAQRVALALDRCGWPEIVGNVGGDDTVFTATANAAAQRAVVSRIEHAVPRRLTY